MQLQLIQFTFQLVSERTALTSGNQILEKVPFKFILTV